MITYLMAFIFYTLAMVGIMLVGFIVYKKMFATSKGENKGSMKILDSLQIAPKKQLLIVKIKNEKFLIASGLEHTTFLAKLQDETQAKYTVREAMARPNVKAMFNQEQPEDDEEEFDNSNFEQMYQAQLAQRQQASLQQARLEKIQKQFRELYEDEPQKVIKAQEQEEEKTLNRKAMIRQLLKDLNETTSAKVGNGFNG